MAPIYYCYYRSPVGRLLMLSQQGKLTNLDFEQEQIAPNPKWILDENQPLFLQVKAALTRYFNGEKETFSTIPLAPQAVRAVGGAVGSNPISIIIPCHRVLGKDRCLTGFGGGLPAKRYLLQLEGIDYLDKGVEYVKPKLLKKYRS